jgi:hypothetical protein
MSTTHSTWLTLAGVAFILLFVLGLFHFLYESIIAPSIREVLRYKLFALRDDLRQLKHDEPNACSDEVFVILQESLNNSINLTKIVTWRLINQIKHLIANNPIVRAEVERRRRILASCPSQLVRQIREKQLDLLIWATAVNNGGALFYVWLLLPFFVIFWAIQRWKRGIAAAFRQVEVVIDLPEEQYKRESLHPTSQPFSEGVLQP